MAYELEQAVSERARVEPELFSMPDGQSFYIGDEVMMIPEAIFDPSKFENLGLEKS